jgi:hypothetical protein
MNNSEDYRRVMREACPPELWAELVQQVVAEAQGEGERAIEARRVLLALLGGARAGEVRIKVKFGGANDENERTG